MYFGRAGVAGGGRGDLPTNLRRAVAEAACGYILRYRIQVHVPPYLSQYTHPTTFIDIVRVKITLKML